jgi:hypothetical protein
MTAKIAPTGAAHMRRRSNAQAFHAEDDALKGPEKRKALCFPKGGRKDKTTPSDFGKRNKLLCESRNLKERVAILNGHIARYDELLTAEPSNIENLEKRASTVADRDSTSASIAACLKQAAAIAPLTRREAA